MAKGRAPKKEPDAWDTACQITNTVLEIAKVILRSTQNTREPGAERLRIGKSCGQVPSTQTKRGHVHVQPIVHYTFVPLIIVLGMTMTGKLAARPLCTEILSSVCQRPASWVFTTEDGLLRSSLPLQSLGLQWHSCLAPCELLPDGRAHLHPAWTLPGHH